MALSLHSCAMHAHRDLGGRSMCDSRKPSTIHLLHSSKVRCLGTVMIIFTQALNKGHSQHKIQAGGIQITAWQSSFVWEVLAHGGWLEMAALPYPHQQRRTAHPAHVGLLVAAFFHCIGLECQIQI